MNFIQTNLFFFLRLSIIYVCCRFVALMKYNIPTSLNNFYGDYSLETLKVLKYLIRI